MNLESERATITDIQKTAHQYFSISLEFLVNNFLLSLIPNFATTFSWIQQLSLNWKAKYPR